jgi:GTP cyclohydrolase I
MHGYNLMHSLFDIIYCYLGESTLHPQKIVVTKLKILHLNFFGTCEHHILIFFCLFKNIALALNLN